MIEEELSLIVYLSQLDETAIHHYLFACPHIVHHLLHLYRRLLWQTQMFRLYRTFREQGDDGMTDTVKIIITHMPLGFFLAYITDAAGGGSLFTEIA